MRKITPITVRAEGTMRKFDTLDVLVLNYQKDTSMNLYWKLLPLLKKDETLNFKIPDGNLQIDLSGENLFGSLTLDQVDEEIYKYVANNLSLTLQ